MIADAYDTVFKDGGLTQLMIIEKSGKAQQPKRLDYPIYKLLLSFLNNYGIHMAGAVMIGEYQVRAITIMSDFDIKNELIIQQLYSFTSGHVNIQLNTPLADGCAFAINYDVIDHSSTLEKYVLGETKESTKFDSLAKALQELRYREAEK